MPRTVDAAPHRDAVDAYPVWWKRKSDGFTSGFINARGKVVFESPYAVCHSFHGGRARCVDKTNLVYLSADFKEVIRLSNSYGWCYEHGFATVARRLSEHEAVMGLLDVAGRTVVDFLFRDVGPIVDGCFFGKPATNNPNHNVHLYDPALNVLARNIAVGARGHFASEGMVVSMGAGACFGYRDTQGRWKIKATYDDAEPFHDGLAAVAMRELRHFRWQFINLKGEVALSDPRWRSVCAGFSEGYAAVARGLKGGRQGVAFIDRQGRQLTDYDFSGARGFVDGLAAVCDQAEKWGYLDRNGKLAIPCQFDGAASFCGALARVEIGERYHYVSRSGEIVCSLPEYFHGELQFMID